MQNNTIKKKKKSNYNSMPTEREETKTDEQSDEVW